MADTPAPPARSRAEVPPAQVPGLEGLLTLAIGVVVVAALYFGREVLVPITLAVLLSFVLAPLMGLLRRARLGRVPSALLAVILALGVILGLGAVIGTQVAQLASDIPRYASTIEQKTDALRGYAAGRIAALMGPLGRQIENAGNRAAEATGAGDPGNRRGEERPPPLPVEVHQPPPSPLETAERVLAPVLSPLATMGVVLIVATFILLQREDLRDRLIRLFGSRDLHRTTAAMDDAAARLSRYFLTQLALNAGFGCLITVGLYLIGVPSPALWGIISGLLRFVPYVGAFISAAFPMALAAAVDPGWSMVVWTAALFLVTEPLMGHVVEPVVYGHSTGLSPVSVVVAAFFWTWLWGPIGLILAMPLTLCLVVLGRHMDRLEFLAVVLGDQPALTPVESFYQRMLAGDADEVLAQAETLLKDRSLSAYYDEVALPGLALAANDAARGVLPPERLGRIREAIGNVVEDLADHDDAEPAPAKPAVPDPAAVSGPDPAHDAPPHWRDGNPVLCVAARGPLDEVASVLLAQVLDKHGFGTRVAPEETVARGRIALLDATGVRLVCISYLDANGSPSTLRYLVRRLRQRLPEARILVGLWQAEDATLTDERLRAAVGADLYCASLRDAVEACLDVARAESGDAPPAAAPQLAVSGAAS